MGLLPLEAKFGFEQFVQEIRVLALLVISSCIIYISCKCYTYSITVVDLVVRAHDASCSSSHSVCKWPEVEFVHSYIVDVGTDSICQSGTYDSCQYVQDW